jgi:hypothetical protein
LTEDRQHLNEWWSALLGEARQASEVVALWFGLVELRRDGGSRWELYAVGCGSFDAHDRSGDWATDNNWIPEQRYLYLQGLDELAERPYKEMLVYAKQLVEELAPQDTWPGPQLRGVAVGFDDGDFEITFAR